MTIRMLSRRSLAGEQSWKVIATGQSDRRGVMNNTLRSEDAASTERMPNLAVSLRLDYVLLTQDIVRADRKVQEILKGDNSTAISPIKGLDIGTGASAVYPLLWSAVDPEAILTGTGALD